MYLKTAMRIPNCYKTLNIPCGADWREVKKAYRVLARRYHPDMNPGNPAHEARFKTISQAYNKLDRHYKALQASPPVRGYTSPTVTAKKPTGIFDAWQRAVDNYVPEKIRQPLHEWAGRIKQHLFELEKKAFLLNIEKAVTLDAGAAATGGTINVRTPAESFQVRIPATRQNRIEILLTEKGGKSFIKGRRGDLLLKIRIVPGGVISPGTTNFFYEMTVPREDIGRVLTLKTIQGAIKFFVPRVTRDGQTFVLKAKPSSPSALQINHILTLHLTGIADR